MRGAGLCWCRLCAGGGPDLRGMFRAGAGGCRVVVGRWLRKTTSLWHAPRTGMPLRLIRSIQFCCPRPASWSTKLDGYKTLQQPGCARPLQSFHADREIAAVTSRSGALVSRGLQLHSGGETPVRTDGLAKARSACGRSRGMASLRSGTGSGGLLRRFRGTRERLSDGRAKPDCRKVSGVCHGLVRPRETPFGRAGQGGRAAESLMASRRCQRSHARPKGVSLRAGSESVRCRRCPAWQGGQPCLRSAPCQHTDLRPARGRTSP